MESKPSHKSKRSKAVPSSPKGQYRGRAFRDPVSDDLDNVKWAASKKLLEPGFFDPAIGSGYEYQPSEEEESSVEEESSSEDHVLEDAPDPDMTESDLPATMRGFKTIMDPPTSEEDPPLSIKTYSGKSRDPRNCDSNTKQRSRNERPHSKSFRHPRSHGRCKDSGGAGKAMADCQIVYVVTRWHQPDPWDRASAQSEVLDVFKHPQAAYDAMKRAARQIQWWEDVDFDGWTLAQDGKGRLTLSYESEHNGSDQTEIKVFKKYVRPPVSGRPPKLKMVVETKKEPPPALPSTRR